MQTAGKICKLCTSSVLLASEGTWCYRCKTVLHRSCLQNADLIYPVCFQRYDAPEAYFAYSKHCPACNQLNDPPRENCSTCGEVTRWDTEKDFLDYLAHLKDVSNARALRGFLELGFGVICVGLLIALFMASESIPFLPIKALSIAAFLGFFDGIMQLIKSRHLRKFR